MIDSSPKQPLLDKKPEKSNTYHKNFKINSNYYPKMNHHRYQPYSQYHNFINSYQNNHNQHSHLNSYGEVGSRSYVCQGLID